MFTPRDNTTVSTRIRSLHEEVFGPIHATPGTRRHRVQMARSVVAHTGLVLTLVQVVVWLMIGVMSASIDSPWWLWTAVSAALGVGVLTRIDRVLASEAAAPSHHDENAQVTR